MAGKKLSKNNVANRQTSKVKIVTSTDCENCKERCAKGEEYLKVFNKRKVGNGVACKL